MQPHHDRAASADAKRPDPAPVEANSLPTRLSIPRAAMNAQISQLRAHHPALRCRFMALSTPERSSAELRPASFSHAANRQEHDLYFNRSRPKRSMRERFAFLQAYPPRRNVLFYGSFSLSLAAPPAGPPLRGRGAFGSSLKGIPPTVPSSRPATPALFRESNPAPQNQKRNYMSSKNAQPA